MVSTLEATAWGDREAIALQPIPTASASQFRAIACSTPQILTYLNPF
ncbi:hypothetical protein [Oscillatoria acuminata]|nr:hypothetical protein [Oscillatoria acuminata]